MADKRRPLWTGFDIDRSRLRTILMPGTDTEWGVIGAVILTGGERLYQMIDPHGTVSLIPAEIVEPILDRHP